MKIKQHGKIPDWELDVKCEYCNAVITLESPDDLFSRFEFNTNSKYHEFAYYFQCLECGHTNRISSALIREDIQHKVKNAEHFLHDIVFKIK